MINGCIVAVAGVVSQRCRESMPRLRSGCVVLLLLAVSAPGIAAQSVWTVTPMAHATVVLTRADPTPYGGSLTELRIVHPTLSAVVAGHEGRVRLTGTLNLEVLTIPGGELTAGAWGEGFVDRRHPHTTFHELNVAAVDVLGALDGGGRMGLVAGKGFVPFGTDDPMMRPILKYPVNHHLAQILERAVVIVQYDVPMLTLEVAWFNGDEPERPGQWPLLRRPDGKWRFGDSRAGRVTLRPAGALELQGSVANVHSPEHRLGAGGEAEKISLSTRWHDRRAWGESYALAEWARTSELGGAFVFRSALGEAMLQRGGWGVAYRFEQTERPEEERLSDPFRSLRPHIENSILGVTRWTLHTVRLTRGLTHPDARLELAPFVEATFGRVTSVERGFFDAAAPYDSNRAGSLSVGLTAGWGMRGHRMGRYGVLALPRPASSQQHVH